jgi:hypothetical protein
LSADRSVVVSVVTQRFGWTAQPRKYVVRGDYETTKKLFLAQTCPA